MMYNHEHEAALISAAKADPNTYDTAGLRVDDFHDPFHRQIWQTISTLVDENLEINDITLVDKGIAASRLIDIPSARSGNVKYYADSVRDLATRRRLWAALSDTATAIKDGRSTAEVTELLEARMTETAEDRSGHLKPVKDFLLPAINEIEKLHKLKGKLRGVPSGFHKLDEALSGFQSGKLYILGARPSIGKTAFAISLVIHMVRIGVAVGFFSLEMEGPDIVGRFLASAGRINLQFIIAGTLQKQHFQAITEIAEMLHESQWWIDDSPNLHLSTLKSRARKMKRQGVQIIFVDYLTLISYENQNMSRPERVGYVSKSLKQLARELHLPIVVLSQVNREAEKQMPTLGHLRQSGEIEEDADVVMFLHRDRDMPDAGGPAALQIAKSRNGPTPRLDMVFLPAYTRFEERAWEKNAE